MQKTTRGPFPISPAKESSTLLTTFYQLHHSNVIPKNRFRDAVAHAQKINSEHADELNSIRTIMMLLADTPIPELVSVKDANKGSVIGLCAFGLLINHQKHGVEIRRIAEQGNGVIILRISGDFETPEYKIELFDTWAEYDDYLCPILAAGDFVSGKNSTLL